MIDLTLVFGRYVQPIAEADGYVPFKYLSTCVIYILERMFKYILLKYECMHVYMVCDHITFPKISAFTKSRILMLQKIIYEK